MQNYKLDWSPYLGPIFAIFFILYFCLGLILLYKSKMYENAQFIIKTNQKGVTDENRELFEKAKKKNIKNLIGCALYICIPLTILIVFDIIYSLLGGRKFDIEPEFHMKHIKNIIFLVVLWGVIGIKLFPQKSKRDDDSKEK